MKKYLFILITFLFISMVKAQAISQSAVPEKVKSYVTQNYPKFKMAEWEYNKKRKAYSASFYENGKHIMLFISEGGELLYSKEDIFTREIPSKIISHINKEYPNSEVTGGYKELKNNVVTYCVEITLIGKNSNNSKTMIFDMNGNILKN